ncbi:hypothetical protein HK405_010746 [Cladochytrium tenue]|nr:hypothetical protein HK405_010746 [Cladochytrium tenue]
MPPPPPPPPHIRVEQARGTAAPSQQVSVPAAISVCGSVARSPALFGLPACMRPGAMMRQNDHGPSDLAMSREMATERDSPAN